MKQINALKGVSFTHVNFMIDTFQKLAYGVKEMRGEERKIKILTKSVALI